MSARVAKLESLLGRVQERAQAPRPVAVAAAPAAEIEEVELDAPDDLSAPVAQDLELDEPELSVPQAKEPEPIAEMDDLDDVEVMEEIEEVDLDEEPASGAVSSGMDAAMDAAASAPPLTPPPESGKEVAVPSAAHEGPTMEQLGETISLEEGKAQDFELDEPVLDEPTLDEPLSAAPEHLEMEIPASTPPAADTSLQAPATARKDLERIRLGEETPVEARISSRPVVSTNVVDFVSSAKEFEPSSFLDLLDASLALK